MQRFSPRVMLLLDVKYVTLFLSNITMNLFSVPATFHVRTHQSVPLLSLAQRQRECQEYGNLEVIWISQSGDTLGFIYRTSIFFPSYNCSLRFDINISVFLFGALIPSFKTFNI